MRPARSPWWGAAAVLQLAVVALAGCNGPNRRDQNIDAQVAYAAAERQRDDEERSAGPARESCPS